ncbi:hypothetical protein [Thetidibacter halocola]|uniref:Uncharacterized protein n=1 Tax=Thetidibacter halocola TaxID=2827239 RepID=A0A8J8B882_9RHOB|nr:hypothetical protein [Thetidibacter halocola]MBS0122898.1 hypothetical protein [Thetidibacter halocola]
MTQDPSHRRPRLFSAANWGQVTLPLLGLALPGGAQAVSQDEFRFDGRAPEPSHDLIDILPGMVRHFGSVDHHMAARDMAVAADGSAWVEMPEPDAPDTAQADDLPTVLAEDDAAQ